MKILYVTNGYPPLSTAGTENYTAGIAAALSKIGHEVRVICGGNWDSGDHNLNSMVTNNYDGVTVTRINLNWTRGVDPNHSLYDNPATALVVEQLLQEYKPDVVHVTSCYTLSASIMRVIKAFDYPLVVTLTDFWFLCPRVNLLRSDGTLCNGRTTAWTCLNCMMADSSIYQRLLSNLPESINHSILVPISHTPAISRQRGFRGVALNMDERKLSLIPLLKMADALISPSKFLADMYISNGLQETFLVEPYGHDLAWLKELKRHNQDDRFVFGYIGRITHSKGVHTLVDAASLLSTDAPVEVHIWGNVEQEPQYSENLTAASTHSPVIFNGPFDRNNVAQVYGQIDVLVVPSLWYENNPLVIQEAFAAGIPVIASNLGGMSEFVTDDVNGLLFNSGDANALAAAMMRFVEDPQLQARLSRGVPPVRTVQEEVGTLMMLYQNLTRVAPEFNN